MNNPKGFTINGYFVLLLLLLFIPSQSIAQDVGKKDIEKYGAWTVTLNYQDPSNPTCQIWSDVLSPEMDYGGMLTVWRDYKREKNLSSAILIEAMIFDVERQQLVSLDNSQPPQFGNGSGVLNGMTRDQQGAILFVANKDNFEKLISSEDQVFMLFAKILTGNVIALGATLDGIEEASNKCGILD